MTDEELREALGIKDAGYMDSRSAPHGVQLLETKDGSYASDDDIIKALRERIEKLEKEREVARNKELLIQAMIAAYQKVKSAHPKRIVLVLASHLETLNRLTPPAEGKGKADGRRLPDEIRAEIDALEGQYITPSEQDEHRDKLLALWEELAEAEKAVSGEPSAVSPEKKK